MLPEQWKPLSPWPEYQVSDRGQVRRYGRVLKSKNGLVKIGGRRFQVKDLVWAHFVGIRPKLHTIKIKNKAKPITPDNLESVRHPMRHFHKIGGKKSTFSVKQQKEWCRLYQEGKGVSELARASKVYPQIIYYYLRKYGVKCRGVFNANAKHYV
jgi:hypothetical protein